ncbi:MAG: hypothetical protein NZ703_13580, partial [Gemmataceae bacterium]|nr:hypothetical protein [Gemmataceae bacterium]
MMRKLPGRLAVFAWILGACAVIPWTTGLRAQPGKAPFRPGFVPYVPPGEWRPAGVQGVQGIAGNQGVQGNQGFQN